MEDEVGEDQVSKSCPFETGSVEEPSFVQEDEMEKLTEHGLKEWIEGRDLLYASSTTKEGDLVTLSYGFHGGALSYVVEVPGNFRLKTGDAASAVDTFNRLAG